MHVRSPPAATVFTWPGSGPVHGPPASLADPPPPESASMDASGPASLPASFDPPPLPASFGAPPLPASFEVPPAPPSFEVPPAPPSWRVASGPTHPYTERCASDADTVVFAALTVDGSGV